MTELQRGLTDIHTHILPGVDDGAQDLFDSCLMAERAIESKVTTIVCTPHCNIPDEYDNYWDGNLPDQIRDLQNCFEEQAYPLTLLAGMEIFITPDIIEKIKNKKVIPLNFTKYYLVEFGFHEDLEWMDEMLEKITEMKLIPVIAHPERYACVQRDPSVTVKWLDMGCELQINRGSLFGKFGRGAWKAAGELLVHDCVSYVASDAHSPYQRTLFLWDAYDFLCEEFSENLAERLLIENPQKMLCSGVDTSFRKWSTDKEDINDETKDVI